MNVQLAFLLIGLIVTAVTVFRINKQLLLPPRIPKEFASSPEQRDAIERAERVVRRGIRSVRWPAMAVTFVTAILAEKVLPHRLFLAGLAPGILVALAWQVVGTRQWWRWVLRQDVDALLVEEFAEDAKFVFPRDSWWGRRARRTWMRIPEKPENPTRIEAGPTYT